jgi:hypothetical protein
MPKLLAYSLGRMRMTLTIHNDLIQRSDEWHAARRGLVTASVVGRLITPKTVQPANNPESRGLALLLASERITGWTEPAYVSDDMWTGIDCEPIARDLYSEHFAPVAEAGFMVEDKWGFQIGCSPDGLVGDDGMIEIKSRRPKAQVATILSGVPPSENFAQLQCALLVSGREWLDYVSYAGGMPLWRHRVYPQQEWFDAIVDAVHAIEEKIQDMTRQYAESVVGLPMTERRLQEEMRI